MTHVVLSSKSPKAYKNRKLNNANFGDFSHTDYQIFLHLVSKIGGVDQAGKYLQPEKLKREHILTAQEFSELFNTDIDNSYRHLKKAVDKLMRSDIKIERPKNNSIARINVCSRAEYLKKEGYIKIKFTDDIMPYLAQVKQRFILYNLKDLSSFKSLYTTRLYELIQEFKETGWMLKSIEQLRDSFAVGNKFETYNNFKRKTFDHACKEINSNYAMNLGYEEIKNGRKIIAVKFIFKKTRVHKVINQKTGIVKKVYIKPEKINKTKNLSISNILEGQISFFSEKDKSNIVQNVQPEYDNNIDTLLKNKNAPRPIKNIMDEMLKQIQKK